MSEENYVKEEGSLKILCPFCNGEWTAKMKQEMNLACEGCDTCGYGRNYDYTIEIYCEHCGKLVYKKEGNQD